MKRLLYWALPVILIGCQDKEEKQPEMTGAYAMMTQVLNDGSKDSSIDRKQLKIYTDKYMMYASPNVADTFANFGIGTYSFKDGKLIENVFYRASDGDTEDSAVLNIEQTDIGYRQVIDALNIDGRDYKLTEEYEKVGSVGKTPLDGTWKQVKSVYLYKNGDSTVNTNVTEFKTYQSGYFIWAITVKDSANQRRAVFGYGPFEMINNNKIKETVQNSTFVTGLMGKTYEVDIEFMAPDSYKQTITFANGDKSIEYYTKLG